MNEHVWRTFKAVSEYQSLTRAARHLNLSQAAVSQHIHRLESDYGTALFVRTSQGMMLTEVGELIYRDIVAMLKVLDDSRQRVQQHNQSSASSLTVGASFTIAEYMLPEMLAKIDHPQDRQNIVVRMANSHDVLDQVVHGDVDLGLVEAPLTHPDVTVRPFLEDRLIVVAPRRHLWARQEEIGLDELVRAPLIIREPGSGTRMVLEEALHQFGISLNQLNVRFMLGTTQAIKAMVAQGLGVSVLSARTILPTERDVFHVLKIRETALMRTFSLVHPKTLESPLARTLVRIILTTLTTRL
jgi:DNA-binding transcriptional LysR family regulator